MLNQKVASLINTQINKELYSAYLYLQFANHFADAGLNGFANWYTIQAQEERDHVMLFLKYLQNNDGKVTLGAIDAPDSSDETHMDVLKHGLKHEEYVTSLINSIYEAAHNVKDYRTMQFLDWFVKEQGEEEMNANDLIKKMELFGNDSRGLYLLNQELSARTYSAPSLVLD
ncbi:MAG: ferritin [Proteobacteria bacterium]|nr:ferritin [Pseudomonadota bacterium]